MKKELVERFAIYHANNWSWGSLHIVLEDFNLLDHHVRFCIDYANETGDQEGHALGHILLQLSATQRRKIAEMYE